MRFGRTQSVRAGRKPLLDATQLERSGVLAKEAASLPHLGAARRDAAAGVQLQLAEAFGVGRVDRYWDRLPAHRSRMVREFIELSEGHIVTEYLPAYAPELNPVEYTKDYWELDERARKRCGAMRDSIGRIQQRLPSDIRTVPHRTTSEEKLDRKSVPDACGSNRHSARERVRRAIDPPRSHRWTEKTNHRCKNRSRQCRAPWKAIQRRSRTGSPAL